MTEEISFENHLTWTGDARGEIAFPSRQKIEVALPAEFGGVEGFPSPEDLFVAAANGCVRYNTGKAIFLRGLRCLERSSGNPLDLILHTLSSPSSRR